MSERKVKEDIMDIEHDLVMVDEFDALLVDPCGWAGSVLFHD